MAEKKGSAKEPSCEAKRVEFVAEDVKSVSLNKAGGSSSNFRFTIMMIDGASIVMSVPNVGNNEANATKAAELMTQVAKDSRPQAAPKSTLKFL